MQWGLELLVEAATLFVPDSKHLITFETGHRKSLKNTPMPKQDRVKPKWQWMDSKCSFISTHIFTQICKQECARGSCLEMRSESHIDWRRKQRTTKLGKVFSDVSVMFSGHLKAWHKQYIFFSLVSALVGHICILEIDLFKYSLIYYAVAHLCQIL